MPHSVSLSLDHNQEATAEKAVAHDCLRILYVINSLLPGGAESLVSAWASQLHGAGHHVEVCTIYTNGFLAERLERQRIRIWDLARDPGIQHYRMRRKYDLRVISPLVRLIRAGDYDIVHLFPASLFVAAASRFAPGPCYLFSEHSCYNRRRRWRVFKLLDRVIYRQYAQVLAVTGEVREALIQWLPAITDKVRVLQNAVDPARFHFPEEQVERVRQELGLESRDRTVLFAGRLAPVKGLDVLLQAIASLSGGLPPTRFLIAGDGPQRRELEEFATRAGVRNKVSFLGVREDIPLLLRVADLVVLPSRWEGLPMILLEAMAARTPVLATAVGGIPQLVEQGIHGWLVSPGDPAALAEGLVTLITSSELREKLSEAAFRKVCEHYSLEGAMKKLVSIYRENSRPRLP